MNNSIKIAVILTAFDKMSAIINSAVNKSNSKLQSLSKSADAFASKAFKNGRDLAAMGLASGAALAKPIKDAMEFEKRMVDIRKQMQEDSPKFVKQMTEDIFKMGREIPLATGELQDMIASSLRMGIAQDKVVQFTKDVAKMSIAFDMVPAEIADSMGKIAGIFKIPIDQIAGMADAINFLDDKSQAKGPEIISVLQGIGGSARFLDPKNAAALASTMVHLGESASTAESGINAMINKLSAATMGSGKFQSALSTLGISASNLQKNMANKATAQGAILDVLDKIRKLDPSKQNEVLLKLFGLEHGPKLAKLVNGVEEYRKQLALVQGQEKGSMNREYLKRIETLASKWQTFKNRIGEVSTKIGLALIPELKKTFLALEPIIQKAADFVSKNPALIKNIGLGVAAFSALSFAGSGLSFMFGGVAKGISLITGPIGRLTKFFVKGESGVSKFGTVLKSLKGVFNGVGAFTSYLRELMGESFKLIGSYVVKLGPVFKNVFTTIGSTVMKLGPILTKAFSFIRIGFIALGRAMMANPIGLIITGIAIAAFAIIKYWEPIKSFFKKLWDNVKGYVMPVINFLKNAFLNFTPLGLIIKHWKKLKPFFAGLWEGIKSIFTKTVSFIKTLFLNFTPLGLIIKHWDAIKDAFTKALEWVKGFGKKFFDAGANIIKQIADGITSKINTITEKIQNVTQKIRNFLPFSPAKEGPLKDIHRIKLVETIAQTIRPNILAGKMQAVMATAIAPRGGNTISNVSNRNSHRQNNTINIHLSGTATPKDAENIVTLLDKHLPGAIKKYNTNKARVSF